VCVRGSFRIFSREVIVRLGFASVIWEISIQNARAGDARHKGGATAVDPEQINHFHTLGFVAYKQLLTPSETAKLSEAFDAAMRKARNDADEPELTQDEHGYSAIRQQVSFQGPPHVPFFDYDPDSFYPLLSDERFVDVFRTLLGDDYMMVVSEGIIHAGGSGWHHDSGAPEGFFTMRVHIYLDALGPDDGCLSVIPGSHFTHYRDALGTDENGMSIKSISRLGVPHEQLPGRYEPGDVIFLNHKTYHASLSSRPGRRCIHLNANKAAHTHSRDELLAALKVSLESPHQEIRITAATAFDRMTAGAS